jgi:hypothetical protein
MSSMTNSAGHVNPKKHSVIMGLDVLESFKMMRYDPSRRKSAV